MNDKIKLACPHVWHGSKVTGTYHGVELCEDCLKETKNTKKETLSRCDVVTEEPDKATSR